MMGIIKGLWGLKFLIPVYFGLPYENLATSSVNKIQRALLSFDR